MSGARSQLEPQPARSGRPGQPASHRFGRRRLGALPLASGAALLLAACRDGGIRSSFPTPAAAGSAGGTRPIGGSLVANPARDEWPQQFLKSSTEVQEAYRYALSHPDILQYMPCFCGCVDQGHKSNKDCYIQETRADGSFVLEPMSFG